MLVEYCKTEVCNLYRFRVKCATKLNRGLELLCSQSCHLKCHPDLKYKLFSHLILLVKKKIKAIAFPPVKTQKRSSRKFCVTFGLNNSFCSILHIKKLVKTKTFAGHKILVYGHIWPTGRRLHTSAVKQVKVILLINKFQKRKRQKIDVKGLHFQKF